MSSAQLGVLVTAAGVSTGVTVSVGAWTISNDSSKPTSPGALESHCSSAAALPAPSWMLVAAGADGVSNSSVCSVVPFVWIMGRVSSVLSSSLRPALAMVGSVSPLAHGSSSIGASARDSSLTLASDRR